MPFLSIAQVYEKFQQHGRNSSHFVWLLDRLRFFETSQGWVFGFTRLGRVTLFALEPLIPEAASESFQAAWEEVLLELKPNVTAFVSVYSPFLQQLRQIGFQSVKVGHEPWIELDKCIPRGNGGKGVRSARNHALKAGLHVQEWRARDIEIGTHKREALNRLLEAWKNSRLLQLHGFLNAVDPFAFASTRRHFVVLNPDNHVMGFLVATPIPAIQSYFMEDMILHRRAPKGTGELLMLESMVALRDAGTLKASLGVVSVIGAEIPASQVQSLPKSVRFLILTIPKIASRFYNFSGLETFRKRFNPGVWQDVHLAVRNENGSGLSNGGAWFLALASLFLAFRPRLRPSWDWLTETIASPFKRYPISWSVGVASLAFFAAVNDHKHSGKLPEWALTHLAFIGEAPFYQWPYRSLISDLLYFDLAHLLICLVPLLALIRWAEKSHRLSFLLPFVAVVSLLDDILNYYLIIKPYHFFQPHLFQKLIAEKDVGGSLWLATLLGLQLCQLRKNREVVFVAICLISVFGFAFSSEHPKTLILNLNHFLFLSLGYVVGKLKFELDRQQSRAVAKNKPPEARCVHPDSRDSQDSKNSKKLAEANAPEGVA